MKTVQITIENGKSFTAEAGKRLTDALEEAGVYLPAPCGGVGKCGKCGITVAAGKLPVTEMDRHFFNAGELARGHRLACAARVEDDLVIRLPDFGEEHFDALAGNGRPGVLSEKSSVCIAVDIGTTTLAAALIEGTSGELTAAVTGVNHQRAFGADVVSRIAAASGGKGGMLQQSIRGNI